MGCNRHRTNMVFAVVSSAFMSLPSQGIHGDPMMKPPCICNGPIHASPRNSTIFSAYCMKELSDHPPPAPWIYDGSIHASPRNHTNLPQTSINTLLVGEAGERADLLVWKVDACGCCLVLENSTELAEVPQGVGHLVAALAIPCIIIHDLSASRIALPHPAEKCRDW